MLIANGMMNLLMKSVNFWFELSNPKYLIPTKFSLAKMTADITIGSNPSPEGEGPGVRALNESTILLQFDNIISQTTHQLILQYKQAIERTKPVGFVECVSAYTSLAVYFDLIAFNHSRKVKQSLLEYFTDLLRQLDLGTESETQPIIKEIPVCYEKEFALDLAELSHQLKITSDKIIELHTSRLYTVYMIGFTPGFPYMGEIDEQLICSRKANPRKKVPAGSVGIAGKQTGIYPFDTPGGWQIIGRTPLVLFSSQSNPPALLEAGMNVKFIPIAKKEFDAIVKA
jgi:inhibitor of KinA